MTRDHKIYRTVNATPTIGGEPIEVETPDGETYRLGLRLDLRNHSPDGFQWGYGGSGPAQLALAMLADATDDEFAQQNYQDLKWNLISGLDGDQPFELHEDLILESIDADYDNE